MSHRRLFPSSVSRWIAAAWTVFLSGLHAQLPDQSTEAHRVNDESVIEWFGYQGRTYFMQVSDDSDPLRKWVWAPVIEEGNDDSISYEFGGDAPSGFARLQYTDEACPEGVTLDEWDADGDGRSNLEEISISPQSNPLAFSSSGTGIPDSWAVAHGLDPNDPTIGQAEFSDSGLSNLEAYQSGVQAHPDANPDNLDGDGLNNDSDADPNEVLIDWYRGPKPNFAVIELAVEDVDDLWLDDFTENGTALNGTKFGQVSGSVIGVGSRRIGALAR